MTDMYLSKHEPNSLATSQADNCRPKTKQFRANSTENPCWNSRKQNGSGTVFAWKKYILPVNIAYKFMN
jgi:hypothetical protein